MKLSDFMSVYQAIEYLQSIRMQWYDEKTGKFTNPEADKIYHLVMNLTRTTYTVEEALDKCEIENDEMPYEKIAGWMKGGE